MRAIRLLQLTTFVSTLDRFVMPPMLISIAADLGAPLSDVVRAASVYFLVYGLTQLVWGTVSDALGLVRTMRLTMFAAAVSTIAAAFASSPLLLAVSRGLAGGFFGAAYPASLVYLGDTVPARERQPEIARLMVGTALGIGLASLGAGLVAQLLSWRAAFVVTGMAAFAVTVALRRLPQPPLSRKGSSVVKALAAVGRTRAAVFVLLMSFTEGVVLLGVLTLLPSAVEQSGTTPTVAGAVTAVFGLAVFVMTRMIVRLTKRLHAAVFIAVGATSATLAGVLLALTRNPVITVVAAVLLGLAWAAMHSSLQTWATEVVPDARATMISLFATALFAGSAVAASAVAGLVEAGSYGTIFLVAAALTVPLGLFGSVSRARWREP